MDQSIETSVNEECILVHSSSSSSSTGNDIELPEFILPEEFKMDCDLIIQPAATANKILLEKLYVFQVNELPKLIREDLEFKHNLWVCLRYDNDLYIDFISRKITAYANIETIEWLDKHCSTLLRKIKKYCCLSMVQSTISILTRANRDKDIRLIKWAMQWKAEFYRFGSAIQSDNIVWMDPLNARNQIQSHFGAILFLAMFEKEHDWLAQLLETVNHSTIYRDACLLRAIELECIDCLNQILQAYRHLSSQKDKEIQGEYLTVAAHKGNIAICDILRHADVKHRATLFTVTNAETVQWVNSHYKKTIQDCVYLRARRLGQILLCCK